MVACRMWLNEDPKMRVFLCQQSVISYCQRAISRQHIAHRLPHPLVIGLVHDQHGCRLSCPPRQPVPIVSFLSLKGHAYARRSGPKPRLWDWEEPRFPGLSTGMWRLVLTELVVLTLVEASRGGGGCYVVVRGFGLARMLCSIVLLGAWGLWRC